ncbi:MAG: hypothetical protein SFU56_16580 [Capsulimonadales bacterium]|nr:hypothetical protein [Capsulimonadales bacterium]
MRITIKPLGYVLLGFLTVLAVVLTFSPAALTPRKRVRASTGYSVAVLSAPAIGVNAVPAAPTVETAGPGVFKDTIMPGWRLDGWAENIRVEETSGQDGRKSLSVESQEPFRGIQFTSETFRPGLYDRVVFYLHGGSKGGQRLRASAKAMVNGEFQGRKGVLLAPLAGKRWEPVVIPLDMLGLTGVRQGISFFVMDNQAKPFHLWIDHVRFLKPGEKAPQNPLPIRQMTIVPGTESTFLDNGPRPLVSPNR